MTSLRSDISEFPVNSKMRERKNLLIICGIIVLTILFALILNFSQHLYYPYPLHVDEYMHLETAKQIVEKEGINNLTDPTGRFQQNDMEIGHHIFLSEIFLLTNMKMSNAIFIPVIFSIFSMIITYIYLRRFSKIAALVAIILIALIPTTVGFLGEKFIVPVNISFIAIPGVLFLIDRFERDSSVKNLIPFVPLISISLLFHPPSGFAVLTIILAYVILLGWNYLKTSHLNLKSEKKKNRKKILKILLISAISFIIVSQLFLPSLLSKGIEAGTFAKQSYLDDIIYFPNYFGIFPLMLAGIGIFFLIYRKNLLIPLSLLLLLIDLLVYIFFQKIFLFPFGRIYIYISILLSISAAMGVYEILKFRGKFFRVGIVVVILLISLSIYEQLPKHNPYQYYQIMSADGFDYENFIWMKENTPKNSTILADSWKSKGLAIFAERKTYSYFPTGPSKMLSYCESGDKFLADKCNNTEFLLNNTVDYVYSCNCENENLTEIKKCIFKLF